MLGTRPAIPAAIKRQLRKEAGFGCAFCGDPFVDYHHIINWAECQTHNPDDMMIVCPKHHRLCTVGAIPQRDQRRHKLRAKNVADGEARGLLYVNADRLAVRFGGGKAINTPVLLNVGGRDIVGARLGEEGRVLISAKIHDKSGRRLGELIDNEWVIDPGAIWDAELRPQNVKIKSEPRNLALAVDCRNDELSIEGSWTFKGRPLAFGPDFAMIDNNRSYGGNTEDCGVMLML